MFFEGFALYNKDYFKHKDRNYFINKFCFLRYKKIKDFQSRNCKILRSNLCLKKTEI